MSLKPLLIFLGLALMLLWLKGGEIEAFLRRHELDGSADVVHSARDALGRTGEEVEQDARSTAEQKRRALRDTAQRLLGPDSP